MSRVLAILAPGFEEIEAVTVIDILRRANIPVTIAGLDDKSVIGSHNINVLCDMIFNQISPGDFSCLFLPGGQPGTNNLKKDPRIIHLVNDFFKSDKLLAAICAAPTVLEKAGVLNGKIVTSYPSEKAIFKNSHYKDEIIVRDGNIITSRGVGTAIDFSLYLVEVLKGREERNLQADRILWDKNSI